MQICRKLRVGSILDQQVELIGPDAISLDSLWRAAGCPRDRSPRDWAELACTLIFGFDNYMIRLSARFPGTNNERPVLWVWDGDDEEPWRIGDLMTQELLARVYAAYLDPSECSDISISCPSRGMPAGGTC